jgi:hypothetical protein
MAQCSLLVECARCTCLEDGHGRVVGTEFECRYFVRWRLITRLRLVAQPPTSQLERDLAGWQKWRQRTKARDQWWLGGVWGGVIEVAAGRSGPRSRVLVQCSGRQVENNTEECERAPREVAGDGAAVAWQGTGGQTQRSHSSGQRAAGSQRVKRQQERRE